MEQVRMKNRKVFETDTRRHLVMNYAVNAAGKETCCNDLERFHKGIIEGSNHTTMLLIGTDKSACRL